MSEPPFLPADVAATRDSYDAIADDYAEHFGAELSTMPLDRSLLVGFAELVQGSGLGPVADIGCGPGHVTAYLHSLGLTAFGVDLSPRMVTVARQAHPDIRFEEGSMTALDLPDGHLGGVVALYSIIHTPPGELPAVFSEFHRVLAPGGHLLVAFQAGDEERHLTEWFGHAVSLHGYRQQPERVARLLADAGFAVRAQLLREPDGPDESAPRAFLLARRDPIVGAAPSRAQ